MTEEHLVTVGDLDGLVRSHHDGAVLDEEGPVGLVVDRKFNHLCNQTVRDAGRDFRPDIFDVARRRRCDCEINRSGRARRGGRGGRGRARRARCAHDRGGRGRSDEGAGDGESRAGCGHGRH